jgi:hypothetical protein
MKKEYHTKWAKIPERYSDEWKALMGVVMKNVNGALANLMLVNPTFEGFSYYHQKLLMNLKSKSGSGTPILLHKFLEQEYRRNSATSIGLGIFIKALQPYMLPFVKIAKNKVGQEFRQYLISSRMTLRKRGSKSSQIIKRQWPDSFHCRTTNGTWYYLAPNLLGIKVRKEKEKVNVLKRFDAQLHRFYQANLVICKTQEGKSVIGIADTTRYKSGFYHRNNIWLTPTHDTLIVKLKDIDPSRAFDDYKMELEPVTPAAVLEYEKQEAWKKEKIERRRGKK